MDFMFIWFRASFFRLRECFGWFRACVSWFSSFLFGFPLRSVMKRVASSWKRATFDRIRVAFVWKRHGIRRNRDGSIEPTNEVSGLRHASN
jgi:hypothetical protein